MRVVHHYQERLSGLHGFKSAGDALGLLNSRRDRAPVQSVAEPGAASGQDVVYVDLARQRGSQRNGFASVVGREPQSGKSHLQSGGAQIRALFEAIGDGFRAGAWTDTSAILVVM